MPVPLPDGIDHYRVDERSSLTGHVTHALRDMILTNKIPPGAQLVQTELAERLGVSRTPLREAIRVLEQDGLVRVSNGNRTVEVVSLSGEDLVELYEIREVIDGLAARLLARRGFTEAAAAELSQSLLEMEASVEPLRGEAFFLAHLAFHAGIVRHCGSLRLQSEQQLVRMTAASLRDAFPRRLRHSGKDVTSYASRAVAEHRAIYDAIATGRQHLAEQVARDHIRNSVDMVPEDRVDDEEL